LIASLGVDGCRGGWFGIQLSGPDSWDFALVERAESLVERFPEATLILIDIPIGLPAKCGQTRACDLLAARLLGPRRASVFPAPCREILAAADYPAALALSRRLTGKGISKQAWNIGPKIRQVDRWLRVDLTSRERVREVHPEVCFQALNSGQTMAAGKRKPAGERQRLELLTGLFPETPLLFEQALRSQRRRLLARDDILDALVNALSGWLSRGRLGSLPAAPHADALGLPMEICYPLLDGGPRSQPPEGRRSADRQVQSSTGAQPGPGS
jgi:predicted RNase H-like nuclease